MSSHRIVLVISRRDFSTFYRRLPRRLALSGWVGLFGFCGGDHADGEVCSRGAGGLAGEDVGAGVDGDASTEDAVWPVL